MYHFPIMPDSELSVSSCALPSNDLLRSDTAAPRHSIHTGEIIFLMIHPTLLHTHPLHHTFLDWVFSLLYSFYKKFTKAKNVSLPLRWAPLQKKKWWPFHIAAEVAVDGIKTQHLLEPNRTLFNHAGLKCERRDGNRSEMCEAERWICSLTPPNFFCAVYKLDPLIQILCIQNQS